MKSSMWKRIKFYGFGFIIGLIFVAIFFNNKGCSWMPSNRIKDSILNKVIVFPDAEIDALSAMGISDSTIYQFLLNADVNFSKSIKEQGVYPKEYVLEVEDSTLRSLQFSLFEDSYITVVYPLENDEKSQQYGNLDGWGEMIRIPKDSSLVFLDKSNYTQCKKRGLNSDSFHDLTMDLKHSGRINFNKSDLMLAKAEHYISFVQDDTLEVEAETIWYEQRITFKDFIWDYKLPCEEK